MLNYYGIDVIYTRRYVLEEVEAVPDKLQATIAAATLHNTNDDMIVLYGYEPISEFIEESFTEISFSDLDHWNDFLINPNGRFPINPFGDMIYHPGAKYYAILTKHKRRYVVLLDEDAGSPLDEIIRIVTKVEEEEIGVNAFVCVYDDLKEFDRDSFREASPDEDGPIVIQIFYKV